MTRAKICLYWISLFVLPSLLTACFQSRSEIAEEEQNRKMQSSLQESVSDHQQRLEKVQGELAGLQGRIEEVEHNGKKDTGELNQNQTDLNKKLADITARLDQMQQKQDLLFAEVTKMQQDTLQAQKEPDSPAPAPGSKKKKTPPTTANNYDKGFAAFKGRHYGEAAGFFNQYLKSNVHPKHYVEANYYLGECYFHQKDYTQAILSYSAAQEKAPKTLFGRKSILRIAESFHILGKKKDSRSFARLLVDGQPDSEEAKAARKYLK